MKFSTLFLASAVGVMLAAQPAAAAPDPILSLDAFKTQVCKAETIPWTCRKKVDGLDQQLNLAFQQTVRTSRNAADLRAMQRRWLVETRDRCSTKTCAEAATAARIRDLQEISVREMGRLEKPMLEPEQREICDGIARAASKGVLADMVMRSQTLPQASPSAEEETRLKKQGWGGSPAKYFSLPIRRGPSVTFADVFTGGTCSSSNIFAVSKPLSNPNETWPSEDVDPNEADDVIRWSTWGGSESVLMFGGRYFIVSLRSSKNLPGIVSWITPIGTLRPICRLEVAKVDRSVAFVREDKALCSVAVNGELPASKWTKEPVADSQWTDEDKERLTADAQPGAYMPEVRVSKVDIDNDGVPETIGLAQYDSGAGCGSSMSNLLLLSENGNRLKTGSMNDALKTLRTENEKPVAIVTYQSRRYVQASLNTAPALFSVSPKAVETECVFHDQPVIRVKTLYPLDGPVRNPAKAQ